MQDVQFWYTRHVTGSPYWILGTSVGSTSCYLDSVGSWLLCLCVWVLSAVNGSLWVADCCVCVWLLSAANGTLWVVINVSMCAVHMGSSRRSHGSCITHTSTTELTMTRKDPVVTCSWKRGKRKVNSLLCCQVEVTCLQVISCYLLTCPHKIMG